MAQKIDTSLEYGGGVNLAHVLKASKGAIGGLTRHYGRHKKENGEYVKFGNQEIDITKIQLNYNLATHQRLTQLEFIKQRTSEVYCLNRKDVNVMCDWIVTKPKEVLEEEREKFFDETYKFLEKRYGKENVISSYVHLDESTPHMHFAFVPITFDKKKNYFKVCANDIINRADLKTFHSDLSKHMQNVFQRDIGVLNQATEQGNKSIKELKADSIAKNELEASKIIAKALIELDFINDSIVSLQREYDLKKSYIDNYDLSASAMNEYSEVAKVNKKLVGGNTVTLPESKWDEVSNIKKEVIALRKTLGELEENISKDKQMSSLEYKNQLEKKLKDLTNENKNLLSKNKELESMVSISLSEVNNAPKMYLQRLENALKDIPNEIKEPLKSILNEHMGLMQMDINMQEIENYQHLENHYEIDA